MRFAYYRVSSDGQSVAMQRRGLGGGFDREFEEVGISGATLAANRPLFGEMLKQLRQGDELHVYDLSRLGRDAIDCQETVEALLNLGVRLVVKDIGVIEGDTGRLVVAVISQLAASERRKIVARTQAGRALARETLATTGKTHRGKGKLGGRDHAANPSEVIAWRRTKGASIAATATHWGISVSTVKRYAAEASKATSAVSL